MPQFLAVFSALIVQYAVQLAVTTAASIAVGLITSELIKPAVPTSQSGKVNLKQNVPDRTRCYGINRKGGDYDFG